MKTDENALVALKQVFGHSAFRPGQEALVYALLTGKDALGVMPTGAGKSVCYQVPALLLPGVALVISPLISLMKDQVAALKAAGVAAAYINSSLTQSQQAEALRRARAGQYKIIYVAPERLDTPDFLNFAMTARISLIAVDEAHCVSQWGRDFRPSYLKITDFIEALPVRPPMGAFTATATPEVKADIVRMLALHNPCAVTTGFDRPNLRFAVQKPRDRYEALLGVMERHTGESGIVYCATRKAVEEVCARLQKDGYKATRYHAGLSDDERRDNQDDFRFDRAQIIVATNAFGMGIDKPDVRYVVHYNMPKNIEAYYQEAGRAGRDGEAADCVLLYGGQDVIMAKWLIEHGEDNPELTMAQRADKRVRDLERLKQMTFYSTSKRCLRQFILRYFGEDAPEDCGNCSVCAGEAREEAPKAKRDGGGRRRTPQSPAATAPLLTKGSLGGGRTRDDAGIDTNDAIADDGLYGQLKALRARLAKEMGVPAYIIFNDATLRDMARKRPATKDAFLEVSGVGEVKCRRYAEAFLAVIGGEAREQSAEKPKTMRKKRPVRGHTAWDEAEDEQLAREFLAGKKTGEMSRAHERTSGAIRARLKRLGLID